MSHTQHDTDSPSPSHDRISVARYTADEVIQNFQALFDSLDYKAELADLGIGSMQLKRRKKALREFKALSIVLWSLALQRSFPEDAAAFFTQFRSSAPMLAASSPEAKRLNNRVNIYIDLLLSKKDTDFQPVAQYLAEVLTLSADDTNRLRLKLSLIMRTQYNLIFKKLV